MKGEDLIIVAGMIVVAYLVYRLSQPAQVLVNQQPGAGPALAPVPPFSIPALPTILVESL